MTPDEQMFMLAKVHKRRETRMAQALSKQEQLCKQAQSRVHELTLEHESAITDRIAQIANLSQQYGKPHHLWAFRRAEDEHNEKSKQELDVQIEAESDLASHNAACDEAKEAHKKTQRRCVKMEEVLTLFSQNTRRRNA